jgi:pimeloyl-ACP methyl ester carboxylesterase
MNKATPLVMIHGLMGSLNFFAPQERMRAVAVHTPDMMGYGRLKDERPDTLTLEAQAAHVVRYVREHVDGACVLLGHSVGGAVAMLAAELAPERVRGVINVEGNFTLADAFWCGKIAAMPDAEWHTEHARLVADPEGWLAKGDIALTPQRLEWAREALANQPRETIQAMARAVVAETGHPGYLTRIRTVAERGTPLFLLAGEKSASGWDLPEWARVAARDYVVQSGVGHMMMLEQPDEFCRTVEGMVAQAVVFERSTG